MQSSRSSDTQASVQVALRIRPQGSREKLEGSRVCTSVIFGQPQVTIGGDRSFTYDYVFDQETSQITVYESCIEKLVEGLFDGFNATVLAYGQTGSGKTHTMGTAFDTGSTAQTDVGVIPRSISHVFQKVSDLKKEAHEGGLNEPTFDVSVQFIELYNEEIIDLLADDRTSSLNVRIHEDSRGEISLHGVTGRQVQDLNSTLNILKNGALNRTVASTNMNEQSSRSHAIFSLHIRQQRVIFAGDNEIQSSGEMEMELLSAKFHFVDLAGSERLKRTGATGDRAKEGISINCGLLALGNVISALGGAHGKVSHVPYRDSKLTRLLQDSLGGNSRTLMIACVSPSDSDFVETLNTLKYANRAKNIKNKVVANQDKSSKLIGELRGRISALESELLEFKQGRRTIGGDGVEAINDQYHENVMLTAEVSQLRFRVKALQETNEILRNRNVQLIAVRDLDTLDSTLSNSRGEYEILSSGKDNDCINEKILDPVQLTIVKYLEELELVRSSLYESQATSDQLRKEVMRWKNQALSGGSSTSQADSFYSVSQQQLLEEARADLEKLKKIVPPTEATSDYASTAEIVEEDGTSNDADDLDEDEDVDDDEEVLFDEHKECSILRDNLVDLQTEISIKERLISELERSERRLAEVRITYEKKLTELSLRIKQTEAERDRILASGAEKKMDKASQEQAKKIREEYERKLSDMRNEFRKLQLVEKEHKRMQARQERERQELMRYQCELKELKRIKVELMKKIKDEVKHAAEQQRNNAKKLAVLDKEARKKDNLIRQLESKDRQREQYIRRNNEEMNRLRKAQKDQAKQSRSTASSLRTPRRVPVAYSSRTLGLKGEPTTELIFSPRQAKMKWNLIEKKLARMVTQKQTVGKMEDELARLLQERHRLIDEITHLEKRFILLNNVVEREAVADQLDGCQQKLNYVQDQITDTQTAIVDLDGTKEPEDDVEDLNMSNVDSIIENCTNLVEAKYLLQHLFNNCLEQAVAAAKAESLNKESEARVQQLEQQSYISEQLLSTVIEDKNLINDVEGIREYSNRKKSRSPSLASLGTGSTSPSLTESSMTIPSTYKVRCHTATTDELLYPVENVERIYSVEQKEESKEDDKREKKKFFSGILPPSATTHPPAFRRHTKIRNTIGGVPSKNRPSQIGKTLNNEGALISLHSSSRLPTLAEASTSEETVVELPPNRERAAALTARAAKSVFARLIPSWSVEASPSTLINRKQGRIVAVRNASNHRVVTRTHTLEGHSKGVLTVATTDELLLSGSKDRTAKLWDLQTGQELSTLGVHPNNVHVVRFVPNSKLAVSVSMYQVRIWDLRTHECVRMLQSSGQVNEGDGCPAGSRQNTVPFLETVVNAAEVDVSGRLLFTTFAGDVRIWNLEKWASFGRMVGAAHSPRSEVSCLAVCEGPENRPWVFTGSRDHYVKMYKSSLGGEGVHESVVEFSPPHYDNVTCIVPYGGHLFTASKDMNIMKFSLTDYQRDHLELKAHNSYVQGMCLVGAKQGSPILSSVCKEGTIKFWDITSTRRMKLIEEIPKAHSDAINSVCSNSFMMFTASSDQTIGFWKQNKQE